MLSVVHLHYTYFSLHNVLSEDKFLYNYHPQVHNGTRISYIAKPCLSDKSCSGEEERG